MPQEFVIKPQIDADLIASLNKHVDHIDWILDKPYSGTKPIVQSGILEKIGDMLWDASGLKENDVLNAIERAREQEESVRLIVAGKEFHHLPWELLYHDHSELGFMGRHPRCVVARRTQGSGDKIPQATGMPFRILLFISSPEDLDPEKSRLDFERGEKLLFTALDDPWTKGEIDIDVAEDGYFKTLLDRLEKNRYNAVIVSMHGVLARNSRGEDEWGLLFEDEGTGRSTPLAGSDIVAGLDRLPRGHRPGLVVLSACRSASAKETAKAIPSVTRRLHESGFERVLGMRLSILDQAASAFSAELFRRLAGGEVLGRAVNLARDQVAGGEWIGADKKP